jgi:hypothetical protein
VLTPPPEIYYGDEAVFFFTVGVSVSLSPIPPVEAWQLLAFEVSPRLPIGLTLDKDTGEITGMSEESGLLARHLIRASNPLGETNATLETAVFGVDGLQQPKLRVDDGVTLRFLFINAPSPEDKFEVEKSFVETLVNTTANTTADRFEVLGWSFASATEESGLELAESRRLLAVSNPEAQYLWILVTEVLGERSAREVAAEIDDLKNLPNSPLLATPGVAQSGFGPAVWIRPTPAPTGNTTVTPL